MNATERIEKTRNNGDVGRWRIPDDLAYVRRENNGKDVFLHIGIDIRRWR